MSKDDIIIELFRSIDEKLGRLAYIKDDYNDPYDIPDSPDVDIEGVYPTYTPAPITPTVPNDPIDNTCPVCNMNFEGIFGYVCNNILCPCGFGGAS